MSVLIKQTCCVIIYLRLWAHSYWTRTNDPRCNWLWKEEWVSSALNSVQCWPVSRQPGVGTKVSYGALLGVFPPFCIPSLTAVFTWLRQANWLLRLCHGCRGWTITVSCRGLCPGFVPDNSTCTWGSLVTGRCSGSELDLDSKHGSVPDCCYLYYGARNPTSSYWRESQGRRECKLPNTFLGCSR